MTPVYTFKVDKPIPSKIAYGNVLYTSETDIDDDNFDMYNKSFKYSNFKFGLQTLSIPLKFRRALDDGTNFPAQVETGVNIGFAPTIKHNWNVFNSEKKTMGKDTNIYSISSGILLNLGATNLNSSSNAPGLISDRRAATFTYGAFLMFGVNNINFGYALGGDSIIGEGASNWVYQGRLWHGLIVALDIIKF